MAKLDDASWHLGGDDYPSGVPDSNAATHIGMFVAWAINNDCWGNVQGVDWSAGVQRVKGRSITGGRFVLELCEGKLFSEMLNEKGLSFAETYYPRTYLKDFQRTLSTGLASDYLVEDSWENYDRIAKVIGDRYAKFTQKPWWRLW